MKKVGILTFHRCINYGAFLQSYSLTQKLMQDSELEVEIIDCNLKTAEKLSLRHCLSKNVFNIYKKYTRLKVLTRVVNKHLKLSKTSLISDNYDELINFINAQNYNFIVIGSDEIFKIDEIYPFPNIYWPDERLKAKIATYAASANRTDFTKLNDAQKNEIKKRLNRIEYISVRDSNTLNNLKKIDETLDIKKVPDPTFSYEFKATPELEKKLIKKYKLDLNKPIMGLETLNQELGKTIREKFGDEYQIVSMFLPNKYTQKFLYDLEPFEWANMYSYFDINITTLFHGTIFSIKNKIPFISVDDEEYYLKFDSKIKDLLTRANMQENLFNLKGNYNSDKLIQRIKYISENKQEQIDLMEAFEAQEKNILNAEISKIVEIIKSSF